MQNKYNKTKIKPVRMTESEVAFYEDLSRFLSRIFKKNVSYSDMVRKAMSESYPNKDYVEYYNLAGSGILKF